MRNPEAGMQVRQRTCHATSGDPGDPHLTHAFMSAPHHRPGGGFRNPWPGAAAHGLADVLKWMAQRPRTSREPNPPATALPRTTPAFATPHAGEGTLGVTWVGHSTFLLQVGALNVLTDPMWSERASPISWVGPRRLVPAAVAFDTLPPIDLVLLSHNHYDHLDVPTVRAIARAHPEAQWVTPMGLAEFVRRHGVRIARDFDWWDEARIGAAKLACMPAQHFSARGLGDRGDTLWCGWTLTAHDRRVYFAGDTAYHPDFARVAERFGPFDMALLPICAYEPRWFMRSVHMNAEEAVRAFGDLLAAHPHTPGRRRVMVGGHWGTFRLTDEPVQEPPEHARRAWDAAGLPPDDLWVLAHGETRTL